MVPFVIVELRGLRLLVFKGCWPMALGLVKLLFMLVFMFRAKGEGVFKKCHKKFKKLRDFKKRKNSTPRNLKQPNSLANPDDSY